MGVSGDSRWRNVSSSALSRSYAAICRGSYRRTPRLYTVSAGTACGTPLFNQTNLLTRGQVEKAFGDRLKTFDRYRRRFDPTDRLLNPFFKDLLSE